MDLEINTASVVYTEESIISDYTYKTAIVDDSSNQVTLRQEDIVFRTLRKVPKVGLMMIGWGGNNGTTLTAGCIANRLKMSWRTKEGEQQSNFYGSLTQSSTIRIGMNTSGQNVFLPFHKILPMVDPNDIVLGGWDISSMNLAESMKRAQVLDYDLQMKLYPHMEHLVPYPGIYKSDFIALNQSDRTDNVLNGSAQENLDAIRSNIREFKQKNKLDKVIVLWTATTERFSDIVPGLNDDAESLLRSIRV